MATVTAKEAGKQSSTVPRSKLEKLWSTPTVSTTVKMWSKGSPRSAVLFPASPISMLFYSYTLISNFTNTQLF